MSKRSIVAASLVTAATLIPIATAAPKPGLALISKRPLVVKGMRFHAGERVTVTAMISDGTDSTTVTSAALTINKSSGGGGCTVAVNQSPDMSLLLIMFIGLALFFRRRLLKL